MLVRVPTVKTNFNKVDFVEALIKAWKNDYSALPTKKQISIIFGQWSIETGQGTFCWNNNVGNSKAADVKGQTIEYCVLSGVWEIINGKRVVLKPEDPGSWFRSFPTLDLGVRHHFDLLRNKRYSIAWKAVEAGDPALFAHLLKKQGYYTAPEADYVKAVTAHSNAFMKATLFEQALEKLGDPDPVSGAVEVVLEPQDFVAPEGMPIIHTFEEIPQHELSVTTDSGPLQLNWVGQLYNFIMMILGLFTKNKK